MLFFVTAIISNNLIANKNNSNNFFLTENHLAILKTLVYSDVFDYPLTYEELYQFTMGIELSKNDFNQILLNDLIPKYVHSNKTFFTLPLREKIIDNRLSKISIAEVKWKQAFVLSYLLSHFPFVRMISITGSLVFNNLKGKDDDIDFFIIIEKNHLWTVRLFIYTLV